MTITISSFSHYCDLTTSPELFRFFYRGHANFEWVLKPTVGRLARHQNLKASKLLILEKSMLRQFQKEGALLSTQATNNWDWFFLARHHGLPTRLLDWSRNPLVALYFAVAEKSSGSFVVYAEKLERIVDLSTVTDPFSVKKVSKILPYHVTPRLAGQEGLFTFHPEPTKAYDSPTLTRLEISSKLRGQMKLALEKCGIHAASMFRDLDGLAKKIAWLE